MKTITAIFILCLAAVSAFSETTESDTQYFHPAANLYIQGDSAGASNLVVQGLPVYPDDGKLKRLMDLIKQQQEQEQENQQQNQDQNQEPNQEQEQQQDQPPQEPNQEPQQEEEEQQQPPPEPQSAEQMSEDEAKQLLDAMRQEEQNKRLQLHPVMGAPVKVDKDW